jgi:AAA domain-containing protein
MSKHPKDWTEAHVNGDAAIREAADKVWTEELKIDPEPKWWRNQVFTAAELQKKTFEPVKFIVPQLIPEGLTLLCGRPKVGKSWAALEIAVSVAMSDAFTCFGGRETIKGHVLYAALEDNQRRLQRRMDKLLSPFTTEWPEGLTLSTAWKRLDEGGSSRHRGLDQGSQGAAPRDPRYPCRRQAHQNHRRLCRGL